MITPEEFRVALQAQISGFPPGFYDSFRYTRTGNNLNHPLTIGAICRVLLAKDPDIHLALDLRLNEGDIKFQPDVVVLSPRLDPQLFIDYESPSSSDARVPIKDVNAYRDWIAKSHDTAPYFVITSLPDKPTPSWELHHTGRKQYNAEFAGAHRRAIHAQIRANPFQFWMKYYRSRLPTPLPHTLFFLNIDSKVVRFIELG